MMDGCKGDERMITTGDWEARKLLPDKHGIITREAWEITTPDYDVVASLEHSAPIRKEADAHLISAAPDMYEALRTPIIHPQAVVVDDLTEAQCRGELKRVCQRIDNFKDIANKALAKAEGK